VFITVDTPVVWDGMFHATVHCAKSAPAPCTGDVDFRVKGGDQSAAIRIAPGKSKKVTADPGGFGVGKGEKTVVVRIEPTGEPSVDVTRRLVHRSFAGGTGGDEWPIRHVVRDRRGDSGNPLDLRKVEAHVRNHRLIMTWTCWGVVTPYKMSHNVANFDMKVSTRTPEAGPAKKFATVFYGSHGPVLFAGSQFGPNDWGGRFYRPSRHAARMSVPLSRYGRHVRELWLEPATYGYHSGQDEVPDMIHFRV